MPYAPYLSEVITTQRASNPQRVLEKCVILHDYSMTTLCFTVCCEALPRTSVSCFAVFDSELDLTCLKTCLKVKRHVVVVAFKSPPVPLF